MKLVKRISLLLAVLMALACVPAIAESEQEPWTCVIMSVGPEANSEDVDLVSEAASAITVPKYNTTIKVVRYSYTTFGDQINLVLASGEKADLTPSYGISLGTGANNGSILELDEYLEEYGQDLLAQIPEADWNCCKINGKIYGVRNNKELATSYGFAMSKAMVDEMGLDVSTIKTEEDMTDVLRQVKEKYPNVWPIGSDWGTGGWNIAYFDALGGDFGILEDCRTDCTDVVNKYESQIYHDLMKRRYEWVQEGLMMPDGSTTLEPANKMIGAGKFFSRWNNYKPGIETEVYADAGCEVVVVPLLDTFSTTSEVGNLWFVPWCSDNPGRAVQILNEIYINPELSNILVNGVEGVHWVYTDKEKNIIDYPEGVTAATSGYPAAAWSWPNELITGVWATNEPSLWEDTLKFNEEAINSPAKGFMWNNENVLAEIAACNNVVAKYGNAMECGELDPDVYLPIFVEELKAAGVDTIIAEKQAQLDAWLASK